MAEAINPGQATTSHKAESCDGPLKTYTLVRVSLDVRGSWESQIPDAESGVEFWFWAMNKGRVNRRPFWAHETQSLQNKGADKSYADDAGPD
jgi:hypothetical protein